MAWGPHNSFQDAYQLASSLIREVEPIQQVMASSLAADVSGDTLKQLWTKCRANANDLANIRTQVVGVLDWAKTQHPATYDIEKLWSAAEQSYGAIADEIEKIMLAADGTMELQRIVAKTVEMVTYAPAETAAVKAAVQAMPDIKDPSKIALAVKA